MRNSSVITLALAVSAPAYAQQPITVEANPPTVTVSFADLNLHSAAGQTRLQSRVRDAAETLCMDRSVRDIGRTAAGLNCLGRAIASAQPQVERLSRPDVTAAQLAAGTITVSARP